MLPPANARRVHVMLFPGNRFQDSIFQKYERPAGRVCLCVRESIAEGLLQGRSCMCEDRRVHTVCTQSTCKSSERTDRKLA